MFTHHIYNIYLQESKPLLSMGTTFADGPVSHWMVVSVALVTVQPNSSPIFTSIRLVLVVKPLPVIVKGNPPAIEPSLALNEDN